jgi:hypothetical protein
MRRKRIMLGAHRFQDGLHFAKRFAEVFQRVLKLTGLHRVHPNMGLPYEDAT